MLNNRPLYKIKPMNRRNIDNIDNDEIWIPKASALNDPFDCSIVPYLDRDIDLKELDSLLDSLANESELFADVKNQEYYSSSDKSEKNFIAHKRVCEKLSKVGILSFIDTPFSAITWSHYGNEHKGMCIEYKSFGKGNLGRFPAHLAGYMLKPVSYTNLMPFCCWEDFLRAPEFVLDSMFTTKHKDWSYENESRIITYNHEGGLALKTEDIGLIVSKVFIGCEVEQPDYLLRISEVCNAKNIPLVKLERNLHSFNLKEPEIGD